MLGSLLGDGDRFVVVDTETTGLFAADRLVEVAAVTVDQDGAIVDEWDTLVDPQRDVGPTHVHGVTASMVSTAPRFEEVAAALAERLSGAVLVAHNLAFDGRMLTREFAQVEASLSPGSGLCTLRLGGAKLADLCQAYRVQLENAHRALGDARATAQLLGRLAAQAVTPGSRADVSSLSLPYSGRTLQREMTNGEEVPMPYLARLASRTRHHGERGATLAYLDLLDRALADLVITADGQAELSDLAGELGLSGNEVAAAHRRYLDELVAAALRDEVVTDEEYELLHGAAAALGLDPATVDAATAAWRASAATVQLAAGMRVCFTGAATSPDGTEIPRDVLHRFATDLGLEPTSSVTKSACDLLVAADPSSQSGKAGKARRYGIPVAHVDDFLQAQPGSTLPVSPSPGP